MASTSSDVAMQKRAVIFDLDGVIVDSEPNYFHAYKRILSRYGITLEFGYFAQKMIGISTDQVLARVSNDFGVSFNTALLEDEKDRLCRRMACRDPRPNLQVISLVRVLKGQCPIAVASGSKLVAINTILGALNLIGLFDVVVSREDVQQAKPHPAIFLMAAERLSAVPESCVVIEDSCPGIEAARRAGMSVIAIRSDYTANSDFSGADLVLSNARGLDAKYIANLLLSGEVLKKRRRKAADAANPPRPAS